MAELEALFTRYDQLVVFDTETTGLYPNRDEIIEFSAAVLERKDGRAEVTREYDNLVALSPGRFVPPKIQALTGITNQDLRNVEFPRPGCAGMWRSSFPGTGRCCWPTMPILI